MLPIKTTHRARLANAAPHGWGRINSNEETAASKTRRAGLTTVGGANRVSGPLAYTGGCHSHQLKQGATQNGNAGRHHENAGPHTKLETHPSGSERAGRVDCTGAGAGSHAQACNWIGMPELWDDGVQTHAQHSEPGALGQHGRTAGSLCVLCLRLHGHPGAQPRLSQATATRAIHSAASAAGSQLYIVSSSGVRTTVSIDLESAISHSRRYIMCSWLSLLRLGWSQFWHKKMRVIHLDLRRNTPNRPVLDALRTAPLVYCKNLSDFGRSTEALDQFGVVLNFAHGSL